MASPSSTSGDRTGPGVVVSILRTSEGRLSLVLDDVQLQPSGSESRWRSSAFFTAREYLEPDLVDGALSHDEFAQIGENIVLRLMALRGLSTKSPFGAG